MPRPRQKFRRFLTCMQLRPDHRKSMSANVYEHRSIRRTPVPLTVGRLLPDDSGLTVQPECDAAARIEGNRKPEGEMVAAGEIKNCRRRTYVTSSRPANLAPLAGAFCLRPERCDGR